MKESPCVTCKQGIDRPKSCTVQCSKWAAWFASSRTEQRIAGQLAKVGMLDEFMQRKKEVGLE